MAKRPLPEVPASKPYLSVRESAAFLGCSPSKIKAMRASKELPNQQEWTREQLTAAAKKRAESPPKPRGKGLKLDLGNPVKKDKGASPAGQVAAASPTPGAAPPSTKKTEPPKKGGFLGRVFGALDVTDDDDEESDE